MKRPSTRPRESLRALRDAEAAKAAQAALRTGDVSEEQIDALDRLSRLVEIEEARRPTWRSRAPLIAVTIATLVVVSVLFFARVASTEIELDVEATRVSFALPARQTVTDMLSLSRLGVGRLREAVIPRARDRDSEVLRSDEGEVAVQVEPATAGDRRGTVTLAGLVLPPATAVSVTHAGAPRRSPRRDHGGRPRSPRRAVGSDRPARHRRQPAHGRLRRSRRSDPAFGEERPVLRPLTAGGLTRRTRQAARGAEHFTAGR